jgi:type 1 fimbriae regulatory protein FimB/type 1 fimbriae regulatory protein FimE
MGLLHALKSIARTGPPSHARNDKANLTKCQDAQPPRRPRNADLREREYLTPKEVDRLQDAARKHSRYGHRDATAILIAHRHGLRASELCELTWNMIELDSGRIHVRRAKNGADSTHPLTGKEIRALRQLRRENLQSRYVFNTERGGPVTRAWFLKMVRRTRELAKLPFPIHPHMLRHGCGFKLANDGVDTRALQHFLGHRNIMHTVSVHRAAQRPLRRVLEGLIQCLVGSSWRRADRHLP